MHRVKEARSAMSFLVQKIFFLVHKIQKSQSNINKIFGLLVSSVLVFSSNALMMSKKRRSRENVEARPTTKGLGFRV